jgi:hypothetical protein
LFPTNRLSLGTGQSDAEIAVASFDHLDHLDPGIITIAMSI